MQFQNLLSAIRVVPRSARSTASGAVWVRVAVASAVMLSAAGCGEDLGKCDETKARTLVINGEGQALYAGQAVLNDSCAAGQCHSSTAKGDDRQGAPAGLDFNLEPTPVVSTGDEDGVLSPPPKPGSASLLVSAKALATLRANQRTVFDTREDIWEQIVDGLMPPDGIGEAYRKTVPGGDVLVEGSTCKRGTEDLSPITKGSTKTILRNWLACGAPVVEVSDDAIPVSALTPKEGDSQGVRGTVGQQMPFCKDCDAPISFDVLYNDVIASSCLTGCHSAEVALGDFAVEGVENAYKVLTEESGKSSGCEAPFVVPGKPEDSFIIAVMGGSTISKLPICTVPMPFGQPYLECGVRQMKKWIEDGAKGPGKEATMSSDAGM